MDLKKYDFPSQKALHQGLQYARGLGHRQLEVEHVALALLRAGLGIDGEAERGIVSKALEAHLDRWPRVYGTIRVDFGKRLAVVLDKAEAAAQGKVVDVEDLWQLLVKESTALQTALAKVVQSANFEPLVPGQKQEEVKKPNTPNKKRADHAAEPEAKKKESQAIKGDKILSQFTIDLSAMAARGEIDPVIGRDGEVRRVLEVLGRKKKNNPLLIGEPGVGKSAVAEAIALRLADGSVPESMRGKHILSLDVGALLAGAKFRGEFEERMKKLLSAVNELSGKVILFIDEIHMIVGAGNQEGGADLANLLKPALARGEIQCLGATTLDEYRKHIEKDAALERRFQPIYVEEPSKSVAIAILRGVKSRYELHHGVQIEDDAIATAVELSVRYITNRRLPDKAFDLIDEAASRLRLQIDSVPVELDILRSEIQNLEIEKSTLPAGVNSTARIKLETRLAAVKEQHQEVEAIWRRHQELLSKLKSVEKNRQEAQDLFSNAKEQSNFEFAARVQNVELPKLESAAVQVRSELLELQKQNAFLRQVVSAKEICDVVSVMTRIPVGKLLEGEAKKLLRLEDRLENRVFGQRHAMNKIARLVKRARAGVNDPRRPTGVVLFLGPTGVGKTETAKALAEELFGDESKIIRIDMSEFMEQHSVARLIGSPPGYVGYGDGGELTEAVRHNPYSVVLFDEIEKAHPRVLDLLLAVFDDGRMTDSRGRHVDFRSTLMILTSNLLQNGAEQSDRDIRQALASKLRPEFVNRLDEVVIFARLGRPHLETLVDRLLSDLNGRLAQRNFRMTLGTWLREALIREGLYGDFGGRAVRRQFEMMVIDAVSDRIIACPEMATGAWVLDVKGGGQITWTPEFRPGGYLPVAG